MQPSSDIVEIVFARGDVTGTCECGAPGCRVYVEQNGNTLGHRCAPCWDRDSEGFERLKADAAALRAKGLDDRMVRRVMCERVDRREYSR